MNEHCGVVLRPLNRCTMIAAAFAAFMTTTLHRGRYSDIGICEGRLPDDRQPARRKMKCAGHEIVVFFAAFQVGR